MEESGGAMARWGVVDGVVQVEGTAVAAQPAQVVQPALPTQAARLAPSTCTCGNDRCITCGRCSGTVCRPPRGCGRNTCTCPNGVPTRCDHQGLIVCSTCQGVICGLCGFIISCDCGYTTTGVRNWGPVPEAQAVGAGALAAASSVLISPQVAPARLYQRLTALVPDEVLPKVSDTAHTLRLRLAASAFLHPSHVSAKGHGRGGRYIALNFTTYPQPRRVQWATPTVPEHTDADGDRVVQCLCYPHYYTKSPLLRMVEVMPPAIDELITFAVQLARPFLTTPSRAQYPNTCELCIYYTAFGSKIGRHRDKFVPASGSLRAHIL